MAKKDFLAKTDDGLNAQFKNFKLKIGGYAGVLGLGAAQVTSQANDTDLFDFVMGMREGYKTKTQDVTNYKGILLFGPTGTPLGAVPSAPAFGAPPTLVLSNVVDRFRKLAAQIKAAPNYNNAIGEDLGIVGDEDSIDESTSKPSLKAKKVETGWSISFSLLSHFDGVKIFRQRPSAPKLFLAVDTSSPYVDTEAQVNGTIYTAYFLIGDNTVGLESDALMISI